MEVRLKIFNRLLNNLIKVKNRGKLTQNQHDPINYDI